MCSLLLTPEEKSPEEMSPTLWLWSSAEQSLPLKRGIGILLTSFAGRRVKSILKLAVFQTKPDKQTTFIFTRCAQRREEKLCCRNDFEASTGCCWKEIIPVH